MTDHQRQAGPYLFNTEDALGAKAAERGKTRRRQWSAAPVTTKMSRMFSVIILLRPR